MNKKILISILLVFIMLTCSFGGNAAAKSSKTQNLTASIKASKSKGTKMKAGQAKKLTTVSFKLLDETIKNDDANANVFISPTSVMFAFGLAENGAKGATRSQIENGLYGGISTQDTNSLMCKLMKKMESNKKVKWNVGNSIWVIDRSDVKVKKNFLKTCKSYYDAEIYKAPFDDSTVKDMNKWVSDNTKGMIPKIVDRFQGDEVMYLINAVAFDGSWAEPFTKAQIQKKYTFHNIDGSTSKVTMMNSKVDGYFELNGAKGFKKYYKGRDYAFVGIEMPEGVTPADYIAALSTDEGAFNNALSDMKYDFDVRIKLPKFKLDYDTEMTSTLENMGITDAFDKNKANLYNMFKKDGDTNYYFDKVLHKTHIEVDQSGTKAAAVTAIAVNKITSVQNPKPQLMISLDHPFVYAIVDTKTNLPIFVGCMNTMK